MHVDRRLLLTSLAVVLLAVIAHGLGLGASFVYDDHRFIEQNPALRSTDLIGYFLDESTASAGGGIQHDIYRPLRTTLWRLEFALFGTRAAWWHAVSICLHALASLLVFRLLRPLVRGRLLAAGLGAALFAAHPVAVESVAWVSSQGDLLAVVLMLGSLIIFERRGVGRTVLGVTLAASACFAKESALVLPALLLLRDLALPREAAPPRRTTWARVGLLALVDIGYLVMREAVVGGMAQVDEFPGGSRLAAARGFLAGLAWYAAALVVPVGVTFDVHLPIPFAMTAPAAVVGLGLLLTLALAGAWGLRRGRPWLAFACWGALACLVPVSNVIVPLKTVVADRFLYPPLVCIAAGVAFAVWQTPVAARRWVAAAVAVLVLVLVPLTWHRTKAWADDLVLWETVLRERPSHMRAYEGLGFEYLRRGRIRDAEIAYRSYLEYNPADAKSMRLLGDAFGEVADSLKLETPRPDERLTGTGRRLARRAQLDMYAQALRTWERVGLVRGRGSVRMLHETWEKVIEAAWDLGDLARAKHANDTLIRYQGIDPSDLDDVAARASFARRRNRVGLAWRVLMAHVKPDLRGEAYERRMQERALILTDVGIAPRVSDDIARRMLADQIDGLVAWLRSDAGRDVLERQGEDVQLSLRGIGLRKRVGDGRGADRRFRELRERYPDLPTPAGDGR